MTADTSPNRAAAAGDITYFADPQLDRLVSLVWQLAGELQVTRHRLAGLEALLTRSGQLPAGAVDRLQPEPADAARLAADRDAYLDRLVRVVAEAGPAAHPLRDQWHDMRRSATPGTGRSTSCSTPSGST